MANANRILTASALALALSACAGTIPRKEALPVAAVDALVPSAFPAVEGDNAVIGVAADVPWSEQYSEAELRSLIDRALRNNRDLRMAMLNVERSRAEQRIVQSAFLPSVGVSSQMQRSGGEGALTAGKSYSTMANVAYEVDLFGKIRNQSAAALNAFFAQEQNQRAAQSVLVSSVAQLYLTTLADRAQLALAKSTLKSNESSMDLVDKRHRVGVASGLEVAQARGQVEAARTQVAQYEGQVAQDLHGLNLLVGEPVASADADRSWSTDLVVAPALPTDVPSTVLLRRPDIMAAEFGLRAANANVAAARAAYFPTIALSGGAGVAGPKLSDLVSGNFVWNFIPNITMPIFQGGRIRAQHEVSKVDQDLALAAYEKSIQTGFREVADGLSLLSTQSDQLTSQTNVARAAARANELVQVRYRYGYDSYLNVLDAQRSLYQAQSALISTQLLAQLNRVRLYQALGGGWK